MRPTPHALLLLLATLLLAACGRDDIRPYTPPPAPQPQPVRLAATRWLHHLDTLVTIGDTSFDYTYHHTLAFHDSATGLLLTHVRVGADSLDEAMPFTYRFDSLALGTLYLSTRNTASGADTVRVVDFFYQPDPAAIRLDDGTLFVPAP